MVITQKQVHAISRASVFEQQYEPHIFASFILRIQCDEAKLHNHFLSYLMNFYREIGVFVTLSRKAVNQANYNRNEISILRVPVPPIHEQHEIVTVAQVLDRKISVHERKRVMLHELFKTLLNRLMTGELRVDKLDIDTSEVVAA